MCVQSLRCVLLFVTPWTVACQAPPVHGIFQARILEWVATRMGCHALLQGIFWTQGLNLCLLLLLHW